MAKSKSEPYGFCREVGKFYNLLGNVGLVMFGLVAIGVTAVYFYFIGWWIVHHWQAAIVTALSALVIICLGAKEQK
jgi:ABC-type proline/glycine betaine transport system permease subunit